MSTYLIFSTIGSLSQLSRDSLDTVGVNRCIENPNLFPDQLKNNSELDKVQYNHHQRSRSFAVRGERNRTSSILDRLGPWWNRIKKSRICF